MDPLSIYSLIPENLEITLFQETKKRFKIFLNNYNNIFYNFIAIIYKKHDFLQISQSIAIVLSFFIVKNIDVSYMYHVIRTQSLMKMYVLFNVLELSEKLIGTLSSDLLSFIKSFDIAIKKNYKKYYISTFFYSISTIIETVILSMQYIVILQSIHACSNTLYALLISNLFLELKSSVFKRGDRKMVFEVLHQDLLKRFNLFLYVTLSFFHIYFEPNNVNDFIKPLLILLFKLLADWVKHAFICRHNNIDPRIYALFDVEFKIPYISAAHNVLFLWMIYSIFQKELFLAVFFIVTYSLSKLY
ncbi:Eukaryotic membrane protein family [Spraguea lophii 42_110]|uniref:Eukaryotic membrane protein family n=1 Tax=Spraguea lophii (strain 42_110) TaxID=1358809 RepID=S7W586_SPRLO|nr:Eukaryotic membrane protein family [Spraguea lophii 42_110]